MVPSRPWPIRRSEVLGHKDAALTLNVYADALAEAKRAGMDRLDEFL